MPFSNGTVIDLDGGRISDGGGPTRASPQLLTPLTRCDYGLPENGTVFCNFNSLYKARRPLPQIAATTVLEPPGAPRGFLATPSHAVQVDPQTFQAWMGILRRVPGSVLWLAESPKVRRFCLPFLNSSRH